MFSFLMKQMSIQMDTSTIPLLWKQFLIQEMKLKFIALFIFSLGVFAAEADRYRAIHCKSSPDCEKQTVRSSPCFSASGCGLSVTITHANPAHY